MKRFQRLSSKLTTFQSFLRKLRRRIPISSAISPSLDSLRSVYLRLTTISTRYSQWFSRAGGHEVVAAGEGPVQQTTESWIAHWKRLWHRNAAQTSLTLFINNYSWHNLSLFVLVWFLKILFFSFFFHCARRLSFRKCNFALKGPLV